MVYADLKNGSKELAGEAVDWGLLTDSELEFGFESKALGHQRSHLRLKGAKSFAEMWD